MLIYNSIKKLSKHQPNIPAICINNQCISYSELIHHVDQLLNYLMRSGVKQRDRIGVYAKHSPELLYLYLAASRLGLTVVFLYDLSEASDQELQNLLDEACLDWIMTDEISERFIFKKFSTDSILCFSNIDREEFLSLDFSAFTKTNFLSSFVQTYTSGTTGSPKGVCLTEIALYIQARQIAQKMKIDFHSHVLLTDSLFSATELSLATAVFLQGATLFFKAYRDMKEIFSEVEHKRITHFMLQPYGIERALSDEQLSRRNLSCLKVIAYGAAAMPDVVIARARMQLACHFVQGYSLTETAGPVAWLLDSEHQSKPGSVGKAVGDTDIIIIGDDGQTATQCEIGEITVKGPTLMSGYWCTMTKQPDAGCMHLGWFYTGDLGYLDEDGYLYLVGRKKNQEMNSIISLTSTCHPERSEGSAAYR